MGELIYRAICKAPIEAQPFLSSQIFLVGGSTKFRGFKERLWQELREALPEVSSWHIPELQCCLAASFCFFSFLLILGSYFVAFVHSLLRPWRSALLPHLLCTLSTAVHLKLEKCIYLTLCKYYVVLLWAVDCVSSLAARYLHGLQYFA